MARVPFVSTMMSRTTCVSKAADTSDRLFASLRNAKTFTPPALGRSDTQARHPNEPIPTADTDGLGGLSSLNLSIGDAWETVKNKLFGNNAAKKVESDLNRVVSVLVGMQGTMNDITKSGNTIPPALWSAHDDLLAKVVAILTPICAQDKAFKLLVPDDVGLQYHVGCIQTTTRTNWHNTVTKMSADVSGLAGLSNLGNLGLVPLVPVLIVIAIVVISGSAVAVTYLQTAEGRARMVAAQKSAENASEITKAVIAGKISVAQGEQLLIAQPKTPDAAPSALSRIGTVAAVGGVALGGLFLFLKMRRNHGS